MAGDFVEMHTLGARMDLGEAGTAVGLGAAALGVLGALGKSIAWLLNYQGERTQQRQKAMTEWEASLQRREMEYRGEIEAEIGELRRAQRHDAARINILSTQVDAMRGICTEFAQEMRALNPDSIALARADAYLRRAFQEVDYGMPVDMQDLVDKLDENRGQS